MNECKSGLFCDFYELTMGQGLLLQNHNPDTVFEMFYRNPPLSSGYAIFTGIDDVIDNIENMRFSKEDIDYLSEDLHLVLLIRLKSSVRTLAQATTQWLEAR